MQALLSPPHYGTRLHFYHEKKTAFCSLVDSRRIALTHALKRSRQLVSLENEKTPYRDLTPDSNLSSSKCCCCNSSSSSSTSSNSSSSSSSIVVVVVAVVVVIVAVVVVVVVFLALCRILKSAVTGQALVSPSGKEE